MHPRELEEAQHPQPEGWSLSLLADILKVGPPLLTEIIKCLESIDDVKKFAELTMMFVPEHDAEVMSAPRNRRVYKFCYFFGKKYYPLPANTDCPPAEWIGGMPVELLGMSYSEYHELAMRPGFLLLLSLVIYPYEGDERDMEEDELGDIEPREMTRDEKEYVRRNKKNKKKVERLIEVFGGARIPLLDKVQRMVGEDIVRKIPPQGWEPAELHKMTNGTKFEGVGEFADWVCGQTGCVMLDTAYDNCDYVEGDGEPVFQWTKRNVDIITEQWPKVKAIRAKMDHIVEWLETDQVSHFTELVNCLLKSAPLLPNTKRKQRWYDPMEHFCELDQAGEEEDDDTTGE
jgi:hypothetical protein